MSLFTDQFPRLRISTDVAPAFLAEVEDADLL